VVVFDDLALLAAVVLGNDSATPNASHLTKSLNDSLLLVAAQVRAALEHPALR
jgi:hypothetical protein